MSLRSIILLIFIAVISTLGYTTYTTPATAPSEDVAFGASFNPSGGGTYRLQTSIGTTNTSIQLSSFLEPISGTPLTMAYMNTDVGYGTLDPQSSTRKEFISFTGVTQNADGTATLTGVTRGLSFNYPYTASSSLRLSHPGQSIFILSDSPQLFNEYTKRRTNEYITGQWGFGVAATSSDECNTSVEYCTKAYIDAGLNQGAATSTEYNLGIVELATSAEIANGTASSTAGGPLVIPNKYATSTPSAVCSSLTCIPAAVGGKIAQAFLDLTASFTWTGDHIFNGGGVATSTFNRGVDIDADSDTPFIIRGLSYIFPFSQTASSTALLNDGSGNLSWNPVYPIVIRDYTQDTVAMTNAGESYTISSDSAVFSVVGTDSFNIHTYMGTDSSSGSEQIELLLGNGTATTTLLNITQASNYYNGNCSIDIVMRGATNAWAAATSCPSSSNTVIGSGFVTSVVDIANGFLLVASTTNSTQAGRVGTVEFTRVERIR